MPDPPLSVEMERALGEALGPVLAIKANTKLPPTGYWFQSIGIGTGTSKMIEIEGFPYPVSAHPERITYIATIPEACHIHARYVLSERKIVDLEVRGLDCPPHI